MTDRHAPLVDDGDDSLSLQHAAQTLWAYRWTMVIALGALVLVFAGAMLLVYLVAPKERLATLSFRLTFDGADRDEFPNGTRFSPAEIVSTPVLSEVHRMNELQRYLKFADFKESVFVLQANADLQLMSYEYQSRLADTKLMPVDRGRIEEEFRRKRESLRSAEYSLNFQRSARALQMPDSVMSKTLQDTLSTWAQQAADRKGAVRYNIPVLSKNVFSRDFFAAEDYSVSVDILRAVAERMLQNVAEIAKLPGASAVRIGDAQMSLAEARSKLEDILRFKLEPLLARIRGSGLSRDPKGLERYFDGRIVQTQLEREEAAQRVRGLQDALRAYLQRGGGSDGSVAPGLAGERGGTVMPQLSESFIDRLVDLSSESRDVEYRQKLTNRIIDEGVTLAQLSKQVQYYELVKKSFSGGGGAQDGGLAAEVSATTEQAYKQISLVTDQVGELYKRIAEQNLNPSAVLYTMTSPLLVTTRPALTLRTVLVYFVATLFAGLVAIPLICLAHAYFRQSISRPAPPAKNEAVRDKETGHIAGV